MKPQNVSLLFVCALLPPIALAQSPPPLNRTEILGRLANWPPSFIAHLVKTRGIDFSPSLSSLDQVKFAGGDGILMERLSSPDPSSIKASWEQEEPPVEHLAKCAELLHKGAHEPAETECRAAIVENPKSPWPLLLTASLLTNNDVYRTPVDPSDMSEEFARAKEREELLKQAAGLDPLHLTEQVDQEFPYARMFFLEKTAGGRLQVPPGLKLALPTVDKELGNGHRLLAYTYFGVQDFENARRELLEAVRLEPDYPVNHHSLAFLYLSLDNENAALAEMRESMRLAPFDTEECQFLSATLEEKGRTAEAIQEFKDLLVISPLDIHATNDLVELYLRHRDRKSAITEVRRSLKASFLKYNDDAKLVEYRYDDELRLGELLWHDGQLDAAAEHYQYLLRYRPQDANFHNDYGNVLLDQNRVDDAFEEYNLALRFDPQMASAYNNIGLCLTRKRDFDGAIDQFRKALELNPEEQHTRIPMGIALAEKGDLDAAKEQFQQFLEEDPKEPEAHASLGYTLFLMKDTPAGIRELRLALELDPDFPDAQNNLAWIYATADDAKLRNPAEALVLARKAVKATGERVPSFLDTLAEALLLNGQPVEALQTEQQAVVLDPNNAKWQSRLARFQSAAKPVSVAKQ